MSQADIPDLSRQWCWQKKTRVVSAGYLEGSIDVFKEPISQISDKSMELSVTENHDRRATAWVADRLSQGKTKRLVETITLTPAIANIAMKSSAHIILTWNGVVAKRKPAGEWNHVIIMPEPL
jgi:hypothetical protein